MKVLFIGDKPSKRTDPNKAFKGAACEKRLTRWIEKVTLKAGLAGWLIDPICREEYELINRVDKDAIYKTMEYYIQDWPIITLGNEAEKFLLSLSIYSYSKLPHPSGKNRQINDLKLINSSLKSCRSYIIYKALQYKRRIDGFPFIWP